MLDQSTILEKQLEQLKDKYQEHHELLRGKERIRRGPAADADEAEVAAWEAERAKDMQKAKKMLLEAIETVVRPKTDAMVEDSW